MTLPTRIHRRRATARLLSLAGCVALHAPIAAAQGAAAKATPPADTALSIGLLDEVTWWIAPEFEAGRFPSAASVRQMAYVVEGQLAVTSYSGVRHAKALRGTRWPDGKKKGEKFEIVYADPALDLALIQPAPRSSQASPGSTGDTTPPSTASGQVEIVPAAFDRSSEDSAPTTAHWLPLADPLRAASPRWASLAEFLPTEVSERAAPADVAPWPRLASTAAAERVGGAPIVDVQGRLVGLWQWAVTDSGSVESTFLSAASVRDFVERAHSAPSPVGQVWTALPLSLTSMPTLDWSSKSPESPQNASKRCEEFRNSVRCGDCDGKGEMPETTKQGGGRPTLVRQVPCGTCDHTGLKPTTQVVDAFRSLSALTSRVSTARGREEVASALVRGMASAFTIDPKRLTEILDEQAKRTWTAADAIAGRAMALRIPAQDWPRESVPMFEAPARIVRSKTVGNLLLREPGVCDPLESESADVLVLATVAGTIAVRGEAYLVLDRATVAPLP